MHLAKFEFQIQPLNRMCLPGYKGSALRGNLGEGLKRAMEVADEGERCPSVGFCIETACAKYERCEYARGFAEKYVPPRPYVLEPPLDQKKEYTFADLIEFNLILFGSSIPYLPYYITAVRLGERLGLGPGRKKFRLRTVVSVNDSERQLVYRAGEDAAVRNTYLPVDLEYVRARCSTAVSRIEVHFLTPTHLQADNETVRLKGPYPELSFEVLFRRILSRCKSLSQHYHGDREEWEWDHRELFARAESVRCVEAQLAVDDRNPRFSRRQKGLRGNLAGFVGWAVYEGEELGVLLPYLKLGEYTHVGKKTTFGLGKYIVRTL